MASCTKRKRKTRQSDGKYRKGRRENEGFGSVQAGPETEECFRFVKLYTKVRYLCLICCGYQVRVEGISIIYKGVRENLWNNGMV